jgi:hypothetical protein
LLAVPSRFKASESWEFEDLLHIIEDTMDLMKVRAVDLDALRDSGDATSPALGQIFPALFLPADPNAPDWERPSSSLNFVADWGA